MAGRRGPRRTLRAALTIAAVGAMLGTGPGVLSRTELPALRINDGRDDPVPEGRTVAMVDWIHLDDRPEPRVLRVATHPERIHDLDAAGDRLSRDRAVDIAGVRLLGKPEERSAESKARQISERVRARVAARTGGR